MVRSSAVNHMSDLLAVNAGQPERAAQRLGGSFPGDRCTAGAVRGLLIVEGGFPVPGKAPVEPHVVHAQEGILDDAEVGRVVEIARSEQLGVALEQAQAAVLAPVDEGQDGKVHLAEGLGQQGRTDGAGGVTGVVLEERRAPAPWKDRPRQEKAGQVQELAQVVVVSQAPDGVAENLLGVVGGNALGPADAQVVLLVLGEGRDDGAFTQHRLDDELFLRIAIRNGLPRGRATWGRGCRRCARCRVSHGSRDSG